MKDGKEEWRGASELLDKKFHEIQNWETTLGDESWPGDEAIDGRRDLGTYMNQLLGGSTSVE